MSYGYKGFTMDNPTIDWESVGSALVYEDPNDQVELLFGFRELTFLTDGVDYLAAAISFDPASKEISAFLTDLVKKIEERSKA